MITLGKRKQVNCLENIYYQFLGYIANHPNDIKVVFERNELSGAWGSEGRIQFYSNNIQNYFPSSSGFSYTAGVGNITSRLNCNDLIQKMYDMGFVIGNNQNYQAIRSNVPSAYQNDFDIGVNLP